MHLFVPLDSSPPTVEFCQSPPVFLIGSPTSKLATDVEWDEPVFSDNSKGKIRVQASHEVKKDD